MPAEYRNEYGEFEPCIWLACSLDGYKYMILLDGIVGWCSAILIESIEG